MNSRKVLQAMICIMVFVILVMAVTPVVAQSGGTKLYLPLISHTYIPPTLSITHAPACDSNENLTVATNLDPASYAAVVYIYVEAWWIKPYWSEPVTLIQEDGEFEVDVTTGGYDAWSTHYAIFIIPQSYVPPALLNEATIPDEVYDQAAIYTIYTRDCQRKINWSGYTWAVKSSIGLTDPGPSYYSDDENDVFVDDQGRLHLKYSYHDNRWWATEIINQSALGYGACTFHLGSRVDQLDPQMVLGLYTWDDTSPDFNHREMDIEFSQWGIPGNYNSQFVVQPYYESGNRHQFHTVLDGNLSTHGFDWQPDRIIFRSFQGDQSFDTGSPYQDWTYTGRWIPPPGQENVRISLWKYWSLDQQDPTGTQEVIVNRFECKK